MLDDLLDPSARAAGSAFAVASVYAGLGQIDQALDWLERAASEHTLSHEVREPGFAVLRADPRYADIVERLEIRRGVATARRLTT